MYCNVTGESNDVKKIFLIQFFSNFKDYSKFGIQLIYFQVFNN